MSSDFHSITQRWQHAKALKPKQKYDAFRAICHDIMMAAEKKDLDVSSVEKCDAYMAMLDQSIHVVGFPQRLIKAKTSINLTKLALLGVDPASVTILVKKSGKVTVESGCLGVGDPIQMEGDSTNIDVDAIEAKKRMFIAIGGDGTFSVILRIIDAIHPVLQLKEYKTLATATSVIQLEVPNGVLQCGDSVHADTKNSLSIKTDPGLYNVCGYLLANKQGVGKYIIVACKADIAQDNAVSVLPELTL